MCFPPRFLYNVYFHRSISAGGVLKCSARGEGKCVIFHPFSITMVQTISRKTVVLFPGTQELNPPRLPLHLLISVFCLLVPSSHQQRNVGGDAFLNERLNARWATASLAVVSAAGAVVVVVVVSLRGEGMKSSMNECRAIIALCVINQQLMRGS